MNRIIACGILILVSGCASKSPSVIGSESGANILVPGRVNIIPLKCEVVPERTGDITVRAYGTAIDLDTTSHSLAVSIERNTIAPDEDITQFFTFESHKTKSFDVETWYRVGIGYQFDVQLDLGSDATNQIDVTQVSLDVIESD